jgi:hypothetical protein
MSFGDPIVGLLFSASTVSQSETSSAPSPAAAFYNDGLSENAGLLSDTSYSTRQPSGQKMTFKEDGEHEGRPPYIHVRLWLF